LSVAGRRRVIASMVFKPTAAVTSATPVSAAP
jgi:hypothetical protein